MPSIEGRVKYALEAFDPACWISGRWAPGDARQYGERSGCTVSVHAVGLFGVSWSEGRCFGRKNRRSVGGTVDVGEWGQRRGMR